MMNVIRVKVGNAERVVKVEPRGNKYSTGYVGKAFFCWKSDRYDLPLVYIKGKKVEDRKTREMVKMFLYEYKKLLKERKTPMHFEASTAESRKNSNSGKKNDGISGVPSWMREEHKVWTLCDKNDGGHYLRRTRFKEESRGVIEEYLPNCRKCAYRVDCNVPCQDPDIMSTEDLFLTGGPGEAVRDALEMIGYREEEGHKYSFEKFYDGAKCSCCGSVTIAEEPLKIKSSKFDDINDLLLAVSSESDDGGILVENKNGLVMIGMYFGYISVGKCPSCKEVANA